MIDSSAPVDPTPEPAPPPAVAEPESAIAEVVAPVVLDEEAALDQQLEAQAIDIPDGDKLVPLSAVTNLRQKLKDAKAGSADAADLRVKLQQAEQQLQATAPLAEAFRALQQAQQQPQAPQQPAGPTAEDTAELEAIARDFDFYKADGALDLEKAGRVQARETRRAAQIAQQQMQPLVTNSLQERAMHNLARAKATLHPHTKTGADPKILDQLVSRIAAQPNGLATLADPDSMKQLWLNAYALSTFNPQTSAPQAQAAAPQAPPLVTEPSGGFNPAVMKPLSDREKRAARDAGMTDKEYMDIAKGMKW